MSPIGAQHPCGSPGCPELVARGKARCAGHTRENDRRRGTAYERGYDATWSAYRKRFLERNPLCLECKAEGRIVPATVCDHIVPHKGDQRLFWDPKNHRPACKPHHDKRVDEGDFGRAQR